MQSLEINELSVHATFPKLKFKLSLQLKAGEVIGLTGSSGVGKSILFKAITDLIKHNGSIVLDGKNKNTFSAPIWRRKVMLVPAESQWWFESVGEHLKLLDKNLLTQLGLKESILSQHIHEISSGEKQRLALLRAIQYQPEVLLLDEPTANLDKTNTEIIEEFTNNYIKHQKSILWVSHNQEQLQRVATSILTITKEEISEAIWK